MTFAVEGKVKLSYDQPVVSEFLFPLFAGSIDQEDMITDILRELSNHNERYVKVIIIS